MIDIIIKIHIFIFIFGVIIGGILIIFDGIIYDRYYVLSDFKQFIRCAFQWQFIPWEYIEIINKKGKTILTIILTILFFPYNILIILILIALKLICLTCRIFCFLFQNKEKIKCH